MRQDGPAASVSVGFVSLGCAKNLVDSQRMADVLLRDGLALAPSPDDADIIIVNTCAFIDAAREESLAEIRAACGRKSAGLCKAVLVAGCFPQRYRETLAAQLPDVDAFVGLDRLDEVGRVARRLASGERGIVEVSARSRRLYEPAGRGVVFSSGCHAYIKIAEGCNHRCAFCAIPSIRGAHRSRSIPGIVREAEGLLERGVRELVLVSQDVTSYGIDTGRLKLPDLLRAVARIGGKFWLRWLYGYPTRVTDELLETMGELDHVCRYLDVPIQHSHPAVLKAMHRGATAHAVAGLAERVRSILPDAALRTTCLLGYPGESREHVDHLVRTVRRSRFDHLGAFVFSPEEGTPAFSLSPRPQRRTAEARRMRVLKAQDAVVAGRLAAMVGTVQEVLLESDRSGRDNTRPGRTRMFAPEVDGRVLVAGADKADRMGDFVRARITAVAGFDLLAERLRD